MLSWMRQSVEIVGRGMRLAPMRFLTIGAISTIAYAALFLTLRSRLGPDGANALALALTALANTQANRRFTFGVRGRSGLLRQHAAGAVVYILALAITAGALDLLGVLDRHPARTLEVTVLVLASGLATVTRYAALRTWVFAASGGALRASDPGPAEHLAGVVARQARLGQRVQARAGGGLPHQPAVGSVDVDQPLAAAVVADDPQTVRQRDREITHWAGRANHRVPKRMLAKPFMNHRGQPPQSTATSSPPSDD